MNLDNIDPENGTQAIKYKRNGTQAI